MNTVTCPICKNQTFKSSIARPYNQCLNCGSLERDRVVYMTLVKLRIPRQDDSILHLSPEKCFINHFSKTHGEKYKAVDLCPERTHSPKIVQRLNICQDLYSMASNSWDLILHNHNVLANIFCSVTGVLQGFNKILKPGGTMIFTIPVTSNKTTFENLNPYLPEVERLKKFGQKNRVRCFGTDVVDLIREALGTDCFIPIKFLFSQQELEEAGVPWQPDKEPNGNSIFLYRKNPTPTLTSISKASRKYLDLSAVKYQLERWKFSEEHDRICEAEIYETIWKNLNHSSVSLEGSYNLPAEINLSLTKSYFNKTSLYKVILFKELTENDKKWLSHRGLSLSVLEKISQDKIDLEESYINHFQPHQQCVLSRKYSTKTFNGYQSMIETGYIYSICPISNRIVRSNQSFHVYHDNLQYFIYRFVGQEVFYLVLGHWRSNKLCLYLPSQELILWFEGNVHLGEHVINQLKSYVVSYWTKVRGYILSHKPKLIAVTYGHLPNIAHYCWNEVTGFQYLAVNQCLQKVDKFLRQPWDYYDIPSLFPEVTTEKLCPIAHPEDLFLTILDNNYFAMRVTDTWVSEALAEKIRTVSINKCEGNQLLMQQIQESKTCFPLLWFTIRTHHRVWLSEVEGIPNIINKLSEDYPHLGVVFDGWGKINGHQEDPKSISIIEKEREALSQIKKYVKPQIKTYDAIGLTNFEKTAWAQAINLYILSEGAGLVHVLWMANKPGVVHTNTNHFKQYIFWSNNRENVQKPVFIPKEYVKDDKGSKHGNYDCDWQVIYNFTLSKLK